MVKRVVSLVVMMVLVLGLVSPSFVQAQVAGAVADGGRMILTGSGAAKVLSASGVVRRALGIARTMGQLVNPFTIGIVLLDVGLLAWDWWSRTYGDTISVGVAAWEYGVGAWPNLGGYGYAYMSVSGRYGGDMYLVSQNTVQTPGYSCSGNDWPFAAGSLPSGSVVVGYAVLTRPAGAGPCKNTSIIASFQSGAALEAGSVPGSTAATPPVDNNQAAVDGMTTAIAQLESTRGYASFGVPLPDGASNDAAVDQQIAMLQAGIDVLVDGVTLTPEVDYTPGTTFNDSQPAPPLAEDVVAGEPGLDLSAVTSAVSSMSAAVSAAIAASQAAVVSAVQAIAAPIVAAVNAIPAAIAASQAAVVSAVQAIAAPIVAAIQGQSTALEGTTAAVESLAAQEAARDLAAEEAATASAAPAVVCVVCTRADQWATGWETLRVAAMAAPVFGLINRIIINPTGTIQRVQTVSTSSFGTLTFDLNAWGINTYIGVVRYVVIFGALIVGYFVIFG